MKNNHFVEWDCLSCKARATRREFIMSMGGLAAAALLREEKLLAQTTPYRIDVHHHYAAPEFQAEMTKRGAGNPNYRNWIPRVSLDEMDKSAVATSMISVTRPGVWFGDVALAKRLARICNDFGAKVVKDYPGRFGLFAVLPLPDVDGAVREVEYALDTLKADGIGILSSYQGKYLGNPAFTPLMEVLNRRKAVVFCHPYCAACDAQTTLTDAQNRGVEFVFDTTRTILSLLSTAAVARFPDIRFIWSHGGGTVPYITSRLAGVGQQLLPKGVMYELQKFYYDTAQAFNPYTMPSFKKMVPPSHILFGT